MEGFGYNLFDDEGTPTEALELIKDGTLTSLIHNSMTASYFESESTGHATRGPRSTLGVGLHQLAIKAGDADEKELYSGKYLLITDLTGMHSGANAISEIQLWCFRLSVRKQRTAEAGAQHHRRRELL